jgi:hypothetical protein
MVDNTPQAPILKNNTLILYALQPFGILSLRIMQGQRIFQREISTKHNLNSYTQFIVPAETVVPINFGTGSGSPVSIDSSTALLPAITEPCHNKVSIISAKA